MKQLFRSHRFRWLLIAAGAGLMVGAVALLVLTDNRPAAFGTSSSGAITAARVPAQAAKLLVAAAGPVKITTADLHALGWDDLDLRQMRVSYEGQPWPVWIAGDQLRFYAVISPTRYMTQTVYWLERTGAPSPALATQPLERASQAAPSDHYTATVRAEENHLYTPQVQEGDHWFWAQITAPATKTFTLTLSAPDGAKRPARAIVATWASTEGPANPDHRYRVAVNERPIAEFAWDGAGWHTIEADIPAGVLQAGENVLRLTAPGDTGVAVDTTLVNWIEVQYPRPFVAEDDRLEFEGSGGDQTLTGFSGPVDLFDVTQPDRITRLTEPPALWASLAGRKYLAVGPQGYQSAQIVPVEGSPDLRAEQAGSDYLAIGPTDLLEPLKPLLDWRAAQGLKVQAVPVEAIYDQFGGGRVSPEAIRAFLQYAAHIGSISPRYVLLVGDASYDTLDYTTAPETNRLPTFFVHTRYGGETASDLGFAQLDDDTTPDLAVGRVPARTVDQVRTFVEKTLAYEKAAAPAEWQKRILAVADGQDASFRDEAQAFLNRFPADFRPALIHPPAGATDANQQIVADLNQGDLLVSYFGHGSVTQWGKDNLFTVKDVAALQNGARLPVVVNMTCLTGLFTHPKVESLTESLLWKREGGAVAVLAPTSLTLATDQSFLSNALVEAFLKDRRARLGDWVLQAWRAMPARDEGQRDVLRTFLVFGDPALKVGTP